MTTVLLGGALGREFGRIWPLEIESAAEAVRAIDAQRPGFRARITGMDCAFHVSRGGEAVHHEDELHLPAGRSLHILPVPHGASIKGVISTILGVALIAASFFVPAAGLLGGLITKGVVAGIGLAATLGGVATLLGGQRKLDTSPNDDQKPSYAFSGVVNVQQQGGCVPLCYGLMVVGSVVISAGVVSQEYQPAGATSGSASSTTSPGAPALPVGAEDP